MVGGPRHPGPGRLHRRGWHADLRVQRSDGPSGLAAQGRRPRLARCAARWPLRATGDPAGPCRQHARADRLPPLGLAEGCPAPAVPRRARVRRNDLDQTCQVGKLTISRLDTRSLGAKPSRMSRGRADVLVIGAGVSGLTTAVCLAEAGAKVRVVAKEPPEATTSAVAGAVWAPYRIGGDSQRISQWSRRSLEVFTALAGTDPGGSGVRLLTSMEVAQQPVSAPEWAPLLDQGAVRPCTTAELPAGYRYGYRFNIPAIDMPAYLAYI